VGLGALEGGQGGAEMSSEEVRRGGDDADRGDGCSGREEPDGGEAKRHEPFFDTGHQSRVSGS
jgi:hypothetical protein